MPGVQPRSRWRIFFALVHLESPTIRKEVEVRLRTKRESQVLYLKLVVLLILVSNANAAALRLVATSLSQGRTQALSLAYLEMPTEVGECDSWYHAADIPQDKQGRRSLEENAGSTDSWTRFCSGSTR